MKLLQKCRLKRCSFLLCLVTFLASNSYSEDSFSASGKIVDIVNKRITILTDSTDLSVFVKDVEVLSIGDSIDLTYTLETDAQSAFATTLKILNKNSIGE